MPLVNVNGVVKWVEESAIEEKAESVVVIKATDFADRFNKVIERRYAEKIRDDFTVAAAAGTAGALIGLAASKNGCTAAGFLAAGAVGVAGIAGAQNMSDTQALSTRENVNEFGYGISIGLFSLLAGSVVNHLTK